MQGLRERLTYANVMVTALAFVVLGGSAYAVARNSVGTKQLKRNAVKTKKIAPGAVTGPKLRNGAVGSAKIANGAVGEAKLAGAVRGKLSGFQPGGVVRIAAHSGNQTSAPEHTLIARGPFTIIAKCWNPSGTTTNLRVFIRTSVSGALLLGGVGNLWGPSYLNPNSAEVTRALGPQVGVAVDGATNSGAWSGSVIHGSTAIQFGAFGFVKGQSVASDANNYGAGGRRCALNSYALASG